jgi:hypothetical protein
VANEYVTIVEAKDWLGLQVSDVADDAKIGVATAAASRAIDEFCRRTFFPDTGNRLFDVSPGDPTHVGIDDAAAVTTVATDDDRDGVYETVWATSDYQLLPLIQASGEPRPYTIIRAVGDRQFPEPTSGGRLGLVQVTATWGWDPVPDPVKQACLILMARIFKRKESPQGVAGFDQFGTIRISQAADPDASRLLEPYVKRLLLA